VIPMGPVGKLSATMCLPTDQPAIFAGIRRRD
jgi:hypothetical protein